MNQAIIVQGVEYPIAPLTREERDRAYELCTQVLQNTDSPRFAQLLEKLVNCLRESIFISILRADPAANLAGLKMIEDIDVIYDAWDSVLELTESLGAAA